MDLSLQSGRTVVQQLPHTSLAGTRTYDHLSSTTAVEAGIIMVGLGWSQLYPKADIRACLS